MPDPSDVSGLEPLSVTRVVSTPAALDTATYRPDVIVLRIAPDEVLVVHGLQGPGAGPSRSHPGDDTSGRSGEAVLVPDDSHAIIVDDTGWRGAWLPEQDAARFLAANCAWPRPTSRPAFAQGMVAHLPVKLWIEADRTLVLISHVLADQLAERMSLQRTADRPAADRQPEGRESEGTGR